MSFRRAVIQAGGEGTRLRPLTLEIPKPLVPVQGQPIASWQVRWFARYGVQDILVIIPPKWERAFQKWRKDLLEEMGDAAPRIELWAEPTPMGTMGAFVHHLADRIGSESFFMTNADELKSFDLSLLASTHMAHKERNPAHGMTLALREVQNPKDYGVASLEDGRILLYEEKPAEPASNVVNSGLYAVEPSVFADADRSKTFLMLERDLFPMLASSGRLGGCVLQGQWFDCGTLERWETAIHHWKPE